MARQKLSLVFAGSGGSGAMTAGALFLRAAASAGYYGLMTQLFGAQVRGGESAALVQISTEPVEAQPDFYDVFFALDWKKIDQFAPEIPLSQNSFVVVDPSAGPIPASISKSRPVVQAVSYDDASETRLARALHGSHVNVTAAAIAAASVGIVREQVDAAADKLFSKKDTQVVVSNQRAIAIGFEKAVVLNLPLRMENPRPGERWLITGNQAVAFGALRGGVRFVGCYPITPATDLVEWLAPRIRDLGGHMVLAEDELASINMVLGASYAGIPAMTVTAGPGLALMTEAIGLGVAAEIPAVVVDVMRAGPSTGIASKTEQSDLNIAIYGGHGDAPRIVLAPLSVADCLTTSEWAVYLAESLQTPILLLSDQMLGQAQAAIPAPQNRPPVDKRRTEGNTAAPNFKRYAIGPDPITPMPSPGAKGYEWVAEGLTHNEAGLPVSGAAAHSAQINKRAKKISQFDPGSLWGEVYGEGDTAIVTFGSSVAPAKEAAKRLAEAGRPARVVALRVISPVPRALARALKGSKRVAVLEQNQSGQLFHHLLANRAIPTIAESIARSGPLPFRPGEITAHLAYE